jgi:hippurate hydrolase
MINTIKDLSENYFDEILDIRRHLHMYPELSFQEFETSKYIKEILNLWGISFTDGYVETGILVVLEGKNPASKKFSFESRF